MTKKISPRQLLFFLSAMTPLSKIILMPTQLVVFSKNDLLLSTALNLVLQTSAVFLVVLLSKQNMSLYHMLYNRFGKIVAKILCCVLSAFLLYAAIVPIMEHKLMVQSVFYDTLPSNIVFAPFFLLSSYLCFRPLASLRRVWDFLMPITIFGFVGICIFAVGEVDLGALLPIGGSGANNILSGTAFTTSWFFDAAVLLAFVGKIEYKKGLAYKSAICYAIGGIALLVFLAIFYGVFSDIAQLQLFAFAKISRYFSAIPVLGRVDYLFIHMLAIAMAFTCTVPLQASCDFLKQSFGEKTLPSTIISLSVNLLMMLLSVFLTFSFASVEKLISQTLFWIFPIFCLIIPSLCLLLGRNHAHS